MILGIFIGLAIILLGAMLFKHAARVETLNHTIHRSLRIVPVRWLETTRRFNIVLLRIVAIFWMAIGGFTLVLTTYKFVPE